MDVAAERQRLLEQIEERAEPAYRAGAMMVTRTRLKLYGVRIPHLRQIARAWQREHRQIAHDDLMPLVEALWEGESQEERVLAVELLERYPQWIPDLTWDHFCRWRRKVDNWGVADALAARVLGPWVLADPETRLARLWELVQDEDVWSRRLALVATVPVNRGHARLTIPDLTLKLIDQVKEERHPMITKAVSWALRDMIRLHSERVEAYLEANQEVLAAHVVREVRNKLRTGLKSGKAET